MTYIFFDQKTASGAVQKEIMQNEELPKNYANKLLENLKNEKYTHPLQTIFGVLILQISNLISKFDKEFKFLLYVIDIYSKYIWVIPLKEKKKSITITNTFLKKLNKPNRKPNKIWVDKIDQ